MAGVNRFVGGAGSLRAVIGEGWMACSLVLFVEIGSAIGGIGLALYADRSRLSSSGLKNHVLGSRFGLRIGGIIMENAIALHAKSAAVLSG